METIGPSTRPIMILLLLLWLWVLLLGPSVYGSPLEIQLLEMMLREAEGYPSNGRDQRDISVLPAASIGCDDKDVSMMQAASIGCDESGSQEQFSHIFDEYDENEDCLDFLPAYEPTFKKELPVEHPCFVRLLLLRTPLLKQDPCANFTLKPETTSTTKKPKKKCNPKNKKQDRNEHMPTQNNKNSIECSPVNTTTISPICSTTASPINSTTSSPICATPATDSKIIKIRKLVPKRKKLQANSTSTSTTSSTTSTTTEPTTLKETTTPEETTSTSTEEPKTTTELETTTIYSTSTTSTTTTTQRPLTENQLKRYRAAQRRRKERKGYRKGTPKVPDPPKIKLDGATQPSEVIQVIMTTEAAELRLQPEEISTTVMPTTTTESTSTSIPETTTEDSCEDEVETTKLPELPESEDAEGEASDRSDSKDINSMEEPCDDTEEQDTNLCPQFMPAAHSNPQSRPPAPYRSRKPVKNYVEPILYEGNFAKPLHRTAPIGPPQRDYIVSNKQIVSRPRPKYRKRIPHSIYMNNIVRGLDCSDEVDHHHSRNPTQPQHYWDMRRVAPPQRSQNLRKPKPQRNLRSFAPVPVRRLHSHPEHSEESEERLYPRERHPEPHPPQHHYPEDEEVLHEERLTPPHAMPTPSLDPCQIEHDHALYGERREHHGDYPQTPASSHFFT